MDYHNNNLSTRLYKILYEMDLVTCRPLFVVFSSLVESIEVLSGRNSPNTLNFLSSYIDWPDSCIFNIHLQLIWYFSMRANKKAAGSLFNYFFWLGIVNCTYLGVSGYKFKKVLYYLSEVLFYHCKLFRP